MALVGIRRIITFGLRGDCDSVVSGLVHVLTRLPDTLDLALSRRSVTEGELGWSENVPV
jgi:hypothetical protein